MSTVTVTNVDELNAAILAADQATSGQQTIDIDGDIALGGTALQTINLNTGVTLTIQGENNAIIDGGGAQRGLVVLSGVVDIQALTIENAVARGSNGGYGGGGGAGLGGGLLVLPVGEAAPNVTLAGVSFVNDSAVGGAGGDEHYDIGQNDYFGGGDLGVPGLGGAGGKQSNGGFGGGGGAYAGNGGFGGGGGGGRPGYANYPAFDGYGGFGGGNGSGNYYYNGSFIDYITNIGAGGGGLGAGGDVFVGQGATLTIADGTLGAGTVVGGAGGKGNYPGTSFYDGAAGSGYGGGIFLQGTQTLTLSPGLGKTLTIAGVIADMAGSDGSSGAGSLSMTGSGTLILSGANTFTGGTTLASGTLEIAVGASAGTGAITFAGPSATLQLDAAPSGGPFANTLANIALGDRIDLAGFAYDATAYATVSPDRTTLTLTDAAGTASFNLSGLPAGIGFRAISDLQTGTLLVATPIPIVAGVIASQSTTAEAPINPFATVTISDPAPNGLETVTIQVTGAGTLADGAGFHGLTATGTPGRYGLAVASPAAVSAEIDALVFTPVKGQTNTATATLTLTDLGTGALQAVLASTQVTDKQIIPVIQGVLATQATTSEAPMTPFAAVTITDPAPNALEAVSIQVNGAGTLSDGTGFHGLTATATPGLYTLAPASPAAVSAEIDALVFTAAAGQPNTTTTTITLSDFGSLALEPIIASTQIIKTDFVPSIQGVVPTSATIAEAPVTPFATLVIFDAAPNAVETVTIQASAGTLSDGMGFHGLSATGTAGFYRLAAARPAAVTAELSALVFTPAAGQPNTTTTTTLTLSDLGSGASQPITVSTQVVNQDPAVAPAVTGGAATQTFTAAGSLTPFAGMTVTDRNVNATDTLTITLSGDPGTLLWGGGSTYSFAVVTSGVTYTLTGSAAVITSELDALVFRPSSNTPNTTGHYSFALSDASSVSATPATSTISVSDINPASAPRIAGSVAGQTTSAEAPLSPFSMVLLGDLNNGGVNSDTLKITLTGPGTLSGVGPAASDGTYTVSGTAAAIQSALRRAVFTPAAGTPTGPVTTGFGLTLTDSVTGTSASDAVTTVTDTVGPTITGTSAGQTTRGGGSVTPFSGVTVGDANSGATDTLSISFSAESGTLAGQGLSGGNGAYSLTGSAAAITGALRSLVFTPAAGQPNTSITTGFTLSATSSSPLGPTAYSSTATLLTSLGSPVGRVQVYPTLSLVDSAGDVFGTILGIGGPSYSYDGGSIFEYAKSTGQLEFFSSLFRNINANTPTGLALDAFGNLTGYTSQSPAGQGFNFQLDLATGASSTTPLPQPFPTGTPDSAGNLFNTVDYHQSNSRLGLSEYVAATGQTKVLTPLPDALYYSAYQIFVDAAGDVFGTSYYNGPFAPGVVYEYVNATGVLKTLATWSTTDRSFGLGPDSSLAVDAAGNVFGTTTPGSGPNGGALVYEIVKDSGQVTILAQLDGAVNGTGYASVVLDGLGDIFVATRAGGTNGTGVLSEVAKVARPSFDTTTTVLNITPAVAPTITGTTAGQTAASKAPVTPFTGVTIGDANAGATETLTITVTGGPGILADGPGFSGTTTLTPAGAGVYKLAGTAAAVTAELDQLTFTPTLTASAATLSLSDLSSAFATPATDDNTTVQTVCFASGTLILTVRGEIAVEELVVGDIVVTASGAHRPICWLGHRRLDCRVHARPESVHPIRIARHAFDENKPAQDLYVSPAHAICVDILGEVLIPACALVNGSTVTQLDVEIVTYWHVELDTHDILIANGLPAESYIDMGNRSFFVESNVVTVDGSAYAKTPEPADRTTDDFCHPFVVDGPLVDAVRLQLRRRAESLGWTLQRSTPFADLHLVIDGRRIDPVVRGLTARFTMPAKAGDAWLVCDHSRPCDVTNSDDRRRLGLCVTRLSIDDGFGGQHLIPLDHPSLGTGLYDLEDGCRRWTNGRVRLPVELWEARSDEFFFLVEVAGPALPRWIEPPDRIASPNGRPHLHLALSA